MPNVPCDKSMLRQVFVNLPSKPPESARTRVPAMMEIGFTRKSGEEWVAFVKDIGVGFEFEQVGKSFGVFQEFHLAEGWRPALASRCRPDIEGRESA